MRSRRLFAEGTDVPAWKSRVEVETLVTRFGATGFLTGWDRGRMFVAFVMNERHIKISVPMPQKGQGQSDAKVEAEGKRRWRVMALTLKAKLEAVHSGVAVFDQEFLSFIVLPDGQTVSEWIAPQLALAYKSGGMPPLLPDYSKGEK